MFIKDLIIAKPGILSSLFKSMLTETAGELSKKIQEYLKNAEESVRKDYLSSLNTTKRKRCGAQKAASVGTKKLSKVIPGLIYQMEQFDVQLIKLSAVVLTDKMFINKLVKRSQIRDFRLKVGGAASSSRREDAENVPQQQQY